MIRNLKALGLAVVAMLSLSVMAASAAQAETGSLTTQEYPATLTGTQIGAPTTFSIGAGVRVMSCTTMNLHGSISGPTDPVTLTPSYANCTAAPGALPMTITTNGCDFTLSATKPGTTGHEAGTGTLSKTIQCPGPVKQIEMHIYENATKHAENKPLCTYDFGEQGPIFAGTYHNRGAGATEDIEITVEEKPVIKNTIGPAILCGAATGANVAATFKGTATLTADNALGQQIGVMIG